MIKDELTLTLTAQEMDTIGNALGQRPYVEVAQLLQKMAAQIQQQQAQQGPQTGPQGGEKVAEVVTVQ